MSLRLLMAVAVVWAASLQQPPPPPPPDPATALVVRLEAAAHAGSRDAVLALAANASAVDDLAAVISAAVPTRVLVKERDRAPIPGGGQRLLLEMFREQGREGRLSTWSVAVAPVDDEWKIVTAVRLAHVSGLYRLELDAARQYAVRNLTVEAPDLTLHMASGSAFVAEAPDGVTAVVLVGRGEMRFSPPDPAEKTQTKIFSGSEVLRTPFEAAFIRVRPSDFEGRFPASALTPRPVSPAQLRRARDVFERYVGLTLQIDLADISQERWSISPQAGDFIAEINTRRFGSLTYTRSSNDAEDITLFDRARRRNISVYSSKAKLAARGRFYSEDDLVDYDVLAYEIDAAITPDRFLIDGTARLKVKIRSAAVATLNLRLAETLNVRGVYAQNFGRLLHLRVIGQSTLLVSLPGYVVGGTELWLTILYGGPVSPQELDREAIAVAQEREVVTIPLEDRHLYSHRAYWYPQSTVSDYAVAKLSITAPHGWDVVASGSPLGPPAAAPGVAETADRPDRLFVFSSARPVRYLAFVVSRLRKVETRTVDGVQLHLQANPRQVGRARDMADEAEDIFRVYTSLVGRAPYPSFTVAFTERNVPGGHSPPYFAVVDQALALPGITWRNDPVSFDNYPAFFLAHEIAHQWWGQAVGWKNYHEQWISEGFAQYFAMLYAEERSSRGALATMLRQMRQTAIAQSSQGPVYLGYRLGHIKRDAAVFRSVVYNKSAMVLHMLRRMVGDDAFFTGLREFYDEWEFKKAGTDDFIAVMERASGKDLSRFFDTWIFGQRIPRVKFTYRVDGTEVVLRFEQQGEATDIPINVTLANRSGASTDVLVRLSTAVTEHRVAFAGRLRSATANADHGALVTVVR